MNDENWQDEYKGMKLLKPFQIKLLDEGAQSLSQAWLLNAMWCDWKATKDMREIDLLEPEQVSIESTRDPWID